MQCGDDTRAAPERQQRHVEREVQQVVYVDHVGLNGAQHVVDAVGNQWRAVRLDKRSASPVVRDLHDGQAFVEPPRDVPVRLMRIVIGAKDGDVMPSGELTAQMKRVDF